MQCCDQQYLKLDALFTSFRLQQPRAGSDYVNFIQRLVIPIREFKIQRRGRQLERQKDNRLN